MRNYTPNDIKISHDDSIKLNINTSNIKTPSNVKHKNNNVKTIKVNKVY